MEIFTSLLAQVNLLSAGVAFSAPSAGAVVSACVAALLLLCSAFASGSEIAFFSLTRENLNEMSESKSAKDKRYKTEETIKKAVDEAIDRMQKYQKALVAFYGYLDEGLVSLTKTNYVLMDGEQYDFEGVYSINLCPDTERMGKLADIVGYSVTHITEDGEETYVNSAKDMNICLFNLNGKEEEFRYEALLYVVHLIEQVKDK